MAYCYFPMHKGSVAIEIKMSMNTLPGYCKVFSMSTFPPLLFFTLPAPPWTSEDIELVNF